MRYFRPLPPIPELGRLFDYNPETGCLVWRHRPVEAFNGEFDARRWNGLHAGQPAGGVHRKHGYITVSIAPYPTAFAAHRICFALQHGFDPGTAMVDHINGVRHDNRAANLRLVSNGQNQQNQNTRPTRGVYWVPRLRKYKVEICANKTRHYLGLFSSYDAARRVFADASRELHGAFSRFNLEDVL